MKKTVSVICAPQPSPNPGMATVDLAFHSLWRQHFRDVTVRYVQLFSQEERLSSHRQHQRAEVAAREAMPFKYEPFRHRLDEVCASDVIVYWGDFFHMAHYRQAMAERLVVMNAVPDRARGLEVTDQHLFLAGADSSVYGKTIVFGGNLLFEPCLSGCLTI